MEKGLGRGNIKCKDPEAGESLVRSGTERRPCGCSTEMLGGVVEFHRAGRS